MRWLEIALRVAVVVLALVLVVSYASEDDWDIIWVVVAGNAVWFLLVAIFRRANPSKDPADYQ